MTLELKEKIRKSMTEYLTSKGWPDKMNNRQIIQELPNLWTKLESEGLLKEANAKGFHFPQFRNVAVQKLQEFDTLQQIKDFFSRG